MNTDFLACDFCVSSDKLLSTVSGWVELNHYLLMHVVNGD